MKFIADRMLGKLSKWLRILGYDTVYPDHFSLHEILSEIKEGRVLLTRDRHLLKDFPEAVFISSNYLEEQMEELHRKGYIDFEGQWFSRCTLCNVVLASISKEEANGLIPEYVRQTAPSFARCPVCKKIFWPGTHLSRMEQKIRQLKSSIA